MKKALIFGVTGQDGAYLADALLKKNYAVHGVKRRQSNINSASRLDLIFKDPTQQETDFILHYGDVTDPHNVTDLIAKIRPDEIYNLAAQSHVAVSFIMPAYTGQVDAIGTLHILEAVRILGLEKTTKFYQASTSELYGKVSETPQSETTSFNPQSPYSIAKIYSFYMTKLYREAYGIFAANGILFNHESPLRGENFVTRKTTLGLAKIKLGLEEKLYLGNLDAKRDWGHAKDYVDAMWRVLQTDNPKDYVIATGEQHSVREFVEEAARSIDLDINWHGDGIKEVGVDQEGREVINIRKEYYRPAEVEALLGDSTLARQELKWKPKIDFSSLVQEMMISDLALLKDGEMPNPFT
jgi:GDPmannose 4,6-dehydratase